ncbi:hypothetical protein [Haloarchaeobius amylolyticus]|uniref:hypothetical protein n=1 Tax=Haloarchaeobius amylolyticus TaxID=1198296 RepID=UPI0022716060|nr:hypothetical protein [Haloarchaeobius amylolyticus]
MRQRLAALCCCLLVLSAGCVGQLGSTGGPGDTTEPPTTDPGTGTDTTDPDDGASLNGTLAEPTTCDQVWVSYWGTGNTAELWQQGNVHVGWTVPANTSMLFVAFEEGTVLGADHVRFEGGTVTADGAAVPIGDLSGEHDVAVVAVVDTNENGEYDPDVDRPCQNEDGDLVWTDWVRFDFPVGQPADDDGTKTGA